MGKLLYFIMLFITISLFTATFSQTALITPTVVERKKADTAWNEKNYKNAGAIYYRLALNPNDDIDKVAGDMNDTISCFTGTDRAEEIDDFREKVIAIHNKNWRLLCAAANSYYTDDNNRYLLNGKNYWYQKDKSKLVITQKRFRVRALQLMKQAELLMLDLKNRETGAFYILYAKIIMSGSDTWSLQNLTDTSILPNYEIYDNSNDYNADYQRYYSRYESAEYPGAAVDKDGRPLFYNVPASWADAKNDGERWRWCLKKAVDADKDATIVAQKEIADFAYSYFDVHTIKGYSWYNTGGNDTFKNIYNVETLTDDETITKLVNGVKRITLPEEYNYIKIYRKLAENVDKNQREICHTLAQIYMDRRQYDKAVAYLRIIKEIYDIKVKEASGKNEEDEDYDDINNEITEMKEDVELLSTITGKWGELLIVGTQPHGEKAKVYYRYRNGSTVHFTAQPINVQKWLENKKAALETNDSKFNENLTTEYENNVDAVNKFTGDIVASWDEILVQKNGYAGNIITITTPLIKAGAYLLTADMKDGNKSRMIIWIVDTSIILKQMPNGIYILVADAVNGKPLANTKINVFGYNIKETGFNDKNKTSKKEIINKEFTADENGQIIIPTGSLSDDFIPNQPLGKDSSSSVGRYFGSYMIIAQNGEMFGYMPYNENSNKDPNEYYNQYERPGTFGITDRPVYRPGDTVKYKVWLNIAKYDPDKYDSPYAEKKIHIKVSDSENKVFYEQDLITDFYGGVTGELLLKKNAGLGEYNFTVSKNDKDASCFEFRVEEYKKPEFEVNIKSPDKQFTISDTITAQINANYYFGNPVAKGTVKYRVIRSDYLNSWYPFSRWEWLYGRGYNWYQNNYNWYPGWNDWGLGKDEYSIWKVYYLSTTTDLVKDETVPIGPDGIVDIAIDTSIEKDLFSNVDQKYIITADVTDESRRTISCTTSILAARKPFFVYAWVDKGYYHPGDQVKATFKAQTLNSKPITGAGEVKVYRISYKDDKITETPVFFKMLDTDNNGTASLTFLADAAGQYRLSYLLTGDNGRRIEGGYIFNVIDNNLNITDFRFNKLELIPDKTEYKPGETANLLINTANQDSTILLFIRPVNNIYLMPQIIKMKGKSIVYPIVVTKNDMPNFFVQAVMVQDGKVITKSVEIIVPPTNKVLNVQILPSAKKYQPGDVAAIKLKVTDADGDPIHGQVVISVYDKAVDYIEKDPRRYGLKEYFWDWQRGIQSYPYNNLVMYEQIISNHYYKEFKNTPDNIRNFGIDRRYFYNDFIENMQFYPLPRERAGGVSLPQDTKIFNAFRNIYNMAENQNDIEPIIRSIFADTAFWNGTIETTEDGTAQVEFKLPQNLTAWKMKCWVMASGCSVGEGETEVVTTKNLLLRMQSPRFFTQKDEVVISANIHNYLTTTKKVKAVLELDGPTLVPLDAKTGKTIEMSGSKTIVEYIEIPANDEKRVDFHVKAVLPGQAIVRMKGITDEESDAMEMTFPVQIHGMLKTESYSGSIQSKMKTAKIIVTVPVVRQPQQSRLEIRWSPTLAGAMVDSLPYLADYPYGCSEQTLNRFLPALITQKVLKNSGYNLTDIKNKRTNLNAQEIGDDNYRMKEWQKINKNSVFDGTELADMVSSGIKRLAAMQCQDGGWGWFSSTYDKSDPFLTALIVHGIQRAKANGAELPENMLWRGICQLKRFQQDELVKLKKDATWSQDNALSAFIYMVLVDTGNKNNEVRDILFKNIDYLPVYARCMFGIALHKNADIQKRDFVIKNINKYLVEDKENQTAYIKLPPDDKWWYWYGSEYEAQAYYLKLLTLTDPKGTKASGMVKYLLNNRKHATYWNSTRDTSYVVEAFADYMKASGEDKPDMNLQVFIDNRLVKTVQINAGNLFTFDNKLVLEGANLTTGAHEVKMVKTGTGPLYFNAYMTNFTLEDNITKAGLEIKVNRKYYKLVRVEKTVKGQGSSGQVLDQKVEKYERILIESGVNLKSGDLVEVELEIDSKNDYEYILFEDMKPAGFEAVEVRSGYTGNEMGAYVEFRDNRVAMFVRTLARGKHSVSYRVRAEIPGKFSALPTKASAMYAPELKANSDEWKVGIKD